MKAVHWKLRRKCPEAEQRHLGVLVVSKRFVIILQMYTKEQHTYNIQDKIVDAGQSGI